MLVISSICGLLLSACLVCSGASERVREGIREPQATSADHDTSSKSIKLSSNNASRVPRNIKEPSLDIMDREEKSELRLVWPPVILQETALGYIRDGKSVHLSLVLELRAFSHGKQLPS